MNDLRRGLAVAAAIARKDAISELRGRQAAGSTLFFAALVLLLFGFALGPDSRRLADAAPEIFAVAARADDLAVVHHGHAAHDGAHRPALEHLVLVEAVIRI